MVYKSRLLEVDLRISELESSDCVVSCTGQYVPALIQWSHSRWRRKTNSDSWSISQNNKTETHKRRNFHL